MKDYEIYPNSPLSEVVFELRFPGEMAVECRRDSFFEIVREKYPKILVPIVKSNTAMALEPYRFANKDESAGILISLNRFGFYQNNYTGYKKFKEEIIWTIDKFKSVFNIQNLSRVGLRYINYIPIIRENGALPFDKFLNINLHGTEKLKYDLENIGYVNTYRLGRAKLNFKLESVKSLQQNEEALVLDYDYFKEGNLSLKNYMKYFDEGQKFIYQLFESLITEQYRKYLRGETI